MIKEKSPIALIIFMLIPLLPACISLPERDMAKPVDLSHNYKMQIDSHIKADIKWWELYNDAELNALMIQAFIHNPNINQIRARLAQAQSAVKQSKAALLPDLTISTARNEYRGDNILNSDFSLIGAAGFEIDLWGKNKARANSAILLAQANHADIAAARITLSASITNSWLDILSLMEQESLLQKQINVNRTILELQQKRFEMGSSSALDILQQEERLAQSEAGMPDILSKQEQAANNISLLIGDEPYNKLKISEKPFPPALDIPKAGLASDLLINRPDIMAAWLRLKSSDWAEKAAWANRLPQFNLSATYSAGGAALNSLFDRWIINAVAGLTAPIFDGGRLKAEQLEQRALSDERYHAYREIVLNAVIEVENSLIKNIYQDKKLDALEKQLISSQKTLEQAQINYINGKSNYINVLNSLNNTQFLEQQIIAEKLKQAQMRTSLYRALGGENWISVMDNNI